MSKGKIYIYSHPSLGNGIVKVGRTNSSAQKRATQHLRLNPKSNEMTVHFEREVENIKWTEKHLHQFLSPYRAKGAHWNSEHYQLSPKYARDLVSEFLKDPQNYILNHSKLNEESPALLTIRFSSDLRKAVRVAAAEEDMSMNAWLLKAAEEKLGNDKSKEDDMKYYAIIDNHSGYLWEITQAPDPVTACQQIDADISPDASREYVPVFAHELFANDTAYHVFELGRSTYDSLRDADGQDDEAIQTVNNHGELVETFKIEE
jgi:predicted HicB family RNase H-like nuclease